MYHLGRLSLHRLATCCPAIQSIVKQAIKTSPLDFGVVCGYRGPESQKSLYDAGKSNALWGESDHNILKGDIPYSFAVDLAPYSSELKNYVWNDDFLWELLHKHMHDTATTLGYKLTCGVIFNGVSDKPHHAIRF